ncbi:uncharacterized protein B0I36DRAFT_338382 [Microdochium trichocladiopsis]|uniref:Uncharacterized protein n=1 Tax=Microdochium trichocladiopsis TaxID=1682393 RepID=A0A9P8XTS0_9PEZI|nr:uncharacterized protein B0I36DRAFT_338382 [Microdochium trichocladiopsis]KAH7014194.1 hypothetical protein B0I36DRAFT_338382 [Microdochium trichocladiopsis]
MNAEAAVHHEAEKTDRKSRDHDKCMWRHRPRWELEDVWTHSTAASTAAAIIDSGGDPQDIPSLQPYLWEGESGNREAQETSVVADGEILVPHPGYRALSRSSARSSRHMEGQIRNVGRTMPPGSETIDLRCPFARLARDLDFPLNPPGGRFREYDLPPAFEISLVNIVRA